MKKRATHLLLKAFEIARLRWLSFNQQPHALEALIGGAGGGWSKGSKGPGKGSWDGKGWHDGGKDPWGGKGDGKDPWGARLTEEQFSDIGCAFLFFRDADPCNVSAMQIRSSRRDPCALFHL